MLPGSTLPSERWHVTFIVQVKDWGTGKAGDFGSLEVDSVTTVQGDPLAAGPDRSFYEQLARHLELCQVRGKGSSSGVQHSRASAQLA